MTHEFWDQEHGPTAPAQAPTPTSTSPSGIDDAMQRLRLLLFGEGGDTGVAGRFEDIAFGGPDPQFEAFKTSGLNLLRGQNAEFFGRRGTGGSGAALNALTRSTGQFESDIGMRQLGRQDDALTSLVEIAALDPSLLIAQLAAENAGESGGGGGRGGITVLCTLLYEKGDLPEEVWKADAKYGQSVHPDILAGYRFWAVPLARQAKKRKWLYRIIKPLVIHWANQMEHEINAPFSFYSIAHDWTGWLLGRLGIPICHIIGKVLKLRKSHGNTITRPA